jgi:antitoxin MazE
MVSPLTDCMNGYFIVLYIHVYTTGGHHMKLLIAKWGNSLAVRLPSDYIRQAGLHEGDRVNAELDANGQIRLTPERIFDKHAFINRLRKLHGKRPQTEPVVEKMRKAERY